MYFACLRVGEISISNNKSEHTLPISAVRIKNYSSKNPQIILTLNSFKHSASPSFLTLPSSDPCCPKAALLEYLSVRPPGPSALFLSPQARPLTSHQVTQALNKSLAAAGLPPKRFSSHSFRAGRASDLAEAGVGETLIRQTGRWKSNAYLQYLRYPLFRLPA